MNNNYYSSKKLISIRLVGGYQCFYVILQLFHGQTLCLSLFGLVFVKVKGEESMAAAVVV